MKVLNYIIKVLVMILVCVVIYKVFEWRYDSMAQYEKAHNCKYDYNDLCYTRQKRPWLFKD